MAFSAVHFVRHGNDNLGRRDNLTGSVLHRYHRCLIGIPYHTVLVRQYRDAGCLKVIPYKLQRTGKSVACEAGSLRRIETKELLNVLPEVGFARNSCIILDVIFYCYPGGGQLRRVTLLDDLDKKVIIGRQNCHFLKRRTYAVHAKVIPSYDLIL
jgi:hypothetical protein